jgi:hypothetical protein
MAVLNDQTAEWQRGGFGEVREECAARIAAD